MRATRRGFLAGLLATGSVPALGWAAAGSPGYLAAAQERDG
ncbi:MAG: twin-arginine translocation pathway signal, partial [Confluentimicrobium sp.]|nr:twin-arginine translocation pathway signal [Actibacterium sp.]